MPLKPVELGQAPEIRRRMRYVIAAASATITSIFIGNMIGAAHQ